MNDDTGGNRGRRHAGLLAVVAAVAVLATACGGNTSSSGNSASANLRQDLAYAQCMRSHGVPNFPDPDASGSFTVKMTPDGAGGTINSRQEQRANDACQHLLPGGQESSVQVQENQAIALKFAECMRSHGVPDYPDPTVTSQGIQTHLKDAGISTLSPQFLAAVSACRSLLPAGVSAP